MVDLQRYSRDQGSSVYFPQAVLNGETLQDKAKLYRTGQNREAEDETGRTVERKCQEKMQRTGQV